MRRRLALITREWLLRARIYPSRGQSAVSPQSLEYLYLIQQRKRLALAASVGRLRPRNILLLPLIGLHVFLKLADLWIANQIIRSIINEYDLLERSDPSRGSLDP